MDELEVVEYNWSQLERTLRFDSEFYKKEYIEIENILKSKPFYLLTDLVQVSDGNHMKISDSFTEKGIPYYRGQDVANFFIEQANPLYITELAYKESFMQRSYLKQNDILLSIVGTIGKLSLVKENNQATCSCKLAILRPQELNSNYISIFLESKYGQKQIERFTRGAVQQGLILEDMNQLLVPHLNDKFKFKIDNSIELSYQKLSESKSLYKEAENILLEELDLLDFEPTQENIAIKSFDESFLATGRLDSEYYQPKYDEIIEKIKVYKGGVDTIEKLCTLKDSNHKPIKDKFYQYIELSNIGATGDITGCTYNQGQSLPSRARRLVNSNDIIISSIEGSLEKIALITEEFDNSLCSTGFYVVRSSKINASTLLVLFKNEMMQQILKQNCSGTILTGMNKDEFLNIAIPLIDIEIQKKIETKIKTSFQLKTESKNLLALAKRAVEVAIEEGEDMALDIIGDEK